MPLLGNLDCVVRLGRNSFLLRGWCNDCRKESSLVIQSDCQAEVVVRLNSTNARIARPDVIEAIGCDSSLEYCGFLVEIDLPEGFSPKLIDVAGQLVPWPIPDESHFVLRQSLLKLCAESCWIPQVLGSCSASIGLEEALAEIVEVRRRESYGLAEAMVQCCREHGLNHPLLDDNQAWIAYEACDFDRAEGIWRSLTCSTMEGIADQAQATLRDLFETPSMSVQLADIARLRARQRPELLWRRRLVQAWLTAETPQDQALVLGALQDIALDLEFKSTGLCEPELLSMSLLASLCEQELRELAGESVNE